MFLNIDQLIQATMQSKLIIAKDKEKYFLLLHFLVYFDNDEGNQKRPDDRLPAAKCTCIVHGA